MKGFFASIGKAILYFLTPFGWIIGMVIGSVIALVIFVFYSFYCLILFFTGRSVFNDLPQDKRAKEILQAQANAQIAQMSNQQAPAPQPQTQVYMQQPQVNLYQGQPYPYPGYPQPGYPYPQGMQNQQVPPPQFYGPAPAVQEQQFDALEGGQFPQIENETPKKVTFDQIPNNKPIFTDEGESDDDVIVKNDQSIDEEMDEYIPRTSK